MARSIAQALGLSGGGRGDGFLEGPGVLVTWCIGHLVELAPPEVYDDKLERWSMATLPILPDEFRLVPAAKTRAQLRIVRDLLGRKDVVEVVNACDSGREGELIFDHVYRLARCKKPVLRLWTASLTDEAIREAYARMKPAAAYVGLRDAARSRSEADWLVGLNGTRAQTLVAQKAGQRGVWSLGRVQTPTLALVVERDRAIREFVARDYFTVEARLGAAAGDFEAKWFRVDGEKTIDRHDQREDAEAVADKARPGPAHVRSVEGKDVRLPPERFYDLTTLQREANRRWGYSAKRTLDVAQALYEKSTSSSATRVPPRVT
jgi:DNA topoisomerase-3